MVLTDNELGMIEQLCYLNNDVAETAGVTAFNGIKSIQQGMTIEEILASFDEESLNRLEGHTAEIGGAYASGAEWASIIRYLKSSDLRKLVLYETMTSSDKTTLALCFAEKGKSSEAYVAFKGTSGGAEWIDNVEGLNASDTRSQKEALDFIESIPFDKVTVTGHSKGSNKAMFVTIASDKVDRCVAYDGQGFSQEFIDKYWAEIGVRGKKITNYSLSTDYVHVLLFPVPNSNQVYCQGFGVENIKHHHSPNSLFVTDEKGNLILDENGIPQIVIIEEDPSMVMLHDFTTFIINNADGNEKGEMVYFVSQLLAMVFGESNSGADKIRDYVFSNPDKLAMIIAYLVKYMEKYNLNAEDIDKLLEVLGLNSLNELINLGGFDLLGLHVDVNLNLANIINYIKEQLTDKNDDRLLKNFLLPTLKAMFAGDYHIDVTDFWEKINSKVKTINTSGGTANAIARTGKIRNFSLNVYDTLMDVISRIENMSFSPVSSWSSYSGEEWYSPLFIGAAIKGISVYFSKVTETNERCKSKIDTVFNNVRQVDSTSASRITNRCQRLRSIYTNLSDIAENIG